MKTETLKGRHAEKDRRQKATPRKRPYSAKGAALLSVPFALAFTVLAIIGLDLSWWWAIPLYGLIGAGLLLLFLAGSLLASRD
ncbi:hypothetical protein [Celeribacter indicus]|uniref:Uncharacterized protein n=1 Tax=Celeribacter indicus TaxID=1208324 RepID=A0A0B5E320_9RHOB|nr:hypothetical protein [Celeribacter indicus]AJE47785.1 hypothetical protein P73_3070 [Celeribacter indicus]SDW22793.1 hypothetical protein SAMN05443573_10254 [Celeribacter indicus]